MKKILVTGGAGFIGSHLCEKLIESGNYVVAVDNLYTGSVDNLKNLVCNKNFEFIKHDIREKIEVLDLDEIYNFACPASPVHYQASPIDTIKTNVLGTLNMLELAQVNDATLLQASTSEVYGDPLIHPQIESYWGNVNPIGIRSCYDEGKRCAETLCMDYNRELGIKTKIIRIFNTYGPKMNKEDGRVVSNFIKQAISDDPLTIYGDGRQTRSFCFVEDLVRGIISMMGSNDNIIGPINLGNPSEFTILELAEKVLKLTGSKSNMIFKALPSDDPRQRKPDISLAKEILGWEPRISLENGLKTMIDFYLHDKKYSCIT